MQLSYQLDEIERAAQYLLDQASTSIIRIDGAMGAGKTTLISAVTKILGVTDTANSQPFLWSIIIKRMRFHLILPSQSS